MKTLALFFWSLLFSFALTAQHVILETTPKNKVYAFGGAIAEIAVDPHAGIAVGGLGGVAVGDFMFGGFGMTAYYNRVNLEKFSYDKSISYGGLFTAYTLFAEEEAHLFANIRLGQGKVHLKSQENTGLDISDNIYVLNPEVGMEVNVSSWAKFIISASFRWVNGVDQGLGMTNADFENYAVGMTFRFGKFK